MDITDKAAITGTGLSAGLAAVGGLKTIANKTKADEVAILYGYKPNSGMGHKVQAERYDRFIRANTKFKTKLMNGNSPKEVMSGLKNRNKYIAKVNTGWGIGLGLGKVPKIPIPASDYSPAQSKDSLILTDTKIHEKVDKEIFHNLLERHTGVKPALGTKHITIAAGASGIGLRDKSNTILTALKDRPDIDLVALTGEMPDNKIQELKELSKKHGGRLKLVGKLPNKDYVDMLRNSDVNVGYGGSSSITEQLGFKNPNILYSNSSAEKANPTSVNNMSFAKKHYNINYYMKGQEVEMGNQLKSAIDNPKMYSREKDVAEFLTNKAKSEGRLIEELKTLSKTVKNTKTPKRLFASAAVLGSASLLTYAVNRDKK